MSNDLISRSKLIDALNLCGCYKHENPKAYDTLMLYEILEAIEDQPTAYDVDKVELLLKAETERINNLDWRKKDAYELGRRDAVKFAIDIVKRGGIE